MGRESGYVFPADPPGGLKKKGAGSWNWILMQSSGQEIILEVDKYAIMHRVKIHARDLRILDPLLSYPSAILGREKAIVLNLEHIKAIITAEEVLLRDPSDDNIAPVVEELRRRLKPVNDNREDNEDDKDLAVQPDAEMGEEDDSPFEFRALEVALEAICSYLAARTIELETAVYPALDMLTSKISSRNLDRVRKLKSQMTRLTARVQKVRDELEQLLDDDDDMADLYLSRKLAGTSSPVSGSGAASWFLASPTIGSKISRASRASMASMRGDDNDVEDLEMLLEAYFMQIDGTLNKLTTVCELHS
ncbi:magnesium transporter MRS2-I-like [Olea europaea subsp. europaea]|uniref:Magnesium transporter n=1 Tax=Olea europaea subsp. europaea TaxID=158383 RepID=A0A8S0QFG3_OLEEU|nr:magnesium transporter MRS2-I-like [Olea europaea subsp. europaea]